MLFVPTSVYCYNFILISRTRESCLMLLNCNAAAGGNSISVCLLKCFLLEVESRTQGLRPRTQKKNPSPRPITDFPRTDLLEAEDRNAQGRGYNAQVFSKKKKRSSRRKSQIFREILVKEKMFMTLADFQQIKK